MAHFEDLPDFLFNDLILLDRIRNVFRNEHYCKTLYEKSVPTQSVASFADLLKKAAP